MSMGDRRQVKGTDLSSEDNLKSTSLDQDQTRQHVGSDLDPNYQADTRVVFLKEFSKELILKKNQ